VNKNQGPMSNQITRRFIKCHNAIIDAGLVRSSSALSKSIGVHRQAVNRVLNGDGEATLPMIQALIEFYSINPFYIMQGDGEMFYSAANIKQNNIAFIPTKAYAGYSEQMADPVYLKNLSYFSFPDTRFSDGEFRCFEIEGDSMEPSFFAGERVICSFVYDIYYEQLLKNFQPYIIIVNQDIFLKRIKNNIQKSKSISLLSDNDFYDPFEVKIEDIKEIWRVELKITDQFNVQPSISVQAKEDAMLELLKEIRNNSKLITDLAASVGV
jgi:hypothetical protein